MDLEHVPCTVCAADEPESVVDAKPFHVVRCKACGMLYTNPRPSADAVLHHYDDAYYGQHLGRSREPRHGLRERWIRGALRHHFGYPGKRTLLGGLATWPIAWRLRRHRKHLDAIPWAGDGTLLDFGCGGGGFLRVQRDRGWTVRGLDFSETVAQRGDDLDITVGTWPGEALADQRFDVITAWHALEHLPDPAGWARQAANQLVPGGYLLVCCPDAGSWAFRKFGADWYQLDLPRHFSHFTHKSLARLLSDAGLVVERTRPQVRSATLRASAAIRAERTGSGFWRYLARRRLLWSLVATATGWLGSCDGVLIRARRRPQ